MFLVRKVPFLQFFLPKFFFLSSFHATCQVHTTLRGTQIHIIDTRTGFLDFAHRPEFLIQDNTMFRKLDFYCLFSCYISWTRLVSDVCIAAVM
jgi:hypothetical protein